MHRTLGIRLVVVGVLGVLVGQAAAGTPKLPADTPLPAHAKVISVEDGRPIHASYTWKAMLTVDCKAKPVVDERAKLDKDSTVKATAADAVLSMFFDKLNAEKKKVGMMPSPPRQVDVELPHGLVLHARVADKTDACGPQIELTVGPAGG